MAYQEIIKKYRNEIIEGLCIDLCPLNEDVLPEVVRLRNQERCRYFLNQSMELTLDMQHEWYENYLLRNNDIYWCVREKNGAIIGTIRLYDITEKSCVQGSVIIDEDYSMGMPYALEAMIMSLEFAFNILKVEDVINEDRCDNAMMNSVSKKLGFKFQKVVEIRGIPYNSYTLRKEYAKIDKYKNSLEKFMNR